MGTHYAEFDTTAHNLIEDLIAQITSSSDWSLATPTNVLHTTSANASSTSLPVTSTASSPLTIGSVIEIGEGATREYRTITNMSGTTFTVAAMSYSHPAGTPIRWGQKVLKATTTRGAEMIIDIQDRHMTVTGNNLGMAVYTDHDGIVGNNRMARYIYWRTNAGAATHQLHCIVSASKEHLFFSIEGPRSGETGAQNNTYGSIRHYMFMSDLVPYDIEDTNPVIFAGGLTSDDYSGSTTAYAHTGHLSRNLDGSSPWISTRLATLDFPKAGMADTINLQRFRAIDSKYLLAPYVAFADDTGMRGRLSSFFFAGFNMADQYEVPAPPVGTKIEYQGQWYKLLPVNKSDAARVIWAQFGSTNNASGTNYMRSPVVAVPCLP